MDSGDQITVEMRLAAIEEKLDRLLAHLGLDGDGPATAVPGRTEAQANTEAQVSALILAGKKIQAIKAYREATGQGLKDAKDAVEFMERSMRANGGRR
ncbi:ribosomal protein L7/L12 [Catenulispora sp. GP43]|uniref:ribosomal protein L7/L12 n=1 Tax=Catenulispora sp. GP43 TaxID=3156263 RepID=UPI00351633D1